MLSYKREQNIQRTSRDDEVTPETAHRRRRMNSLPPASHVQRSEHLLHLRNITEMSTTARRHCRVRDEMIVHINAERRRNRRFPLLPPRRFSLPPRRRFFSPRHCYGAAASRMLACHVIRRKHAATPSTRFADALLALFMLARRENAFLPPRFFHKPYASFTFFDAGCFSIRVRHVFRPECLSDDERPRRDAFQPIDMMSFVL